MEVDEHPILCAFLGEPFVFSIENSDAGWRIGPGRAGSQLHVLINVFIPALGAVQVLAGDEALAHQLVGFHWTNGCDTSWYQVKVDEDGDIDLEPAGDMDAAIRQRVAMLTAYDLKSYAAGYIDNLYATALSARHQAPS